MRSRIVAGALLLASLPARAEVAEVADFAIVASEPSIDDLVFARQVLPASRPAGDASAVAASRVVYLNRRGVTLSPGHNDARTNHSTLVKQATTIPPWTVGDTMWTETVACIRELFSPFNIAIVEHDPGAAVQHIEAVFAASPTQLGLASNYAGISPFMRDCGTIENSIVLTFTSVLPPDARAVCEIQAQEIAHSFGLDHVLLPADPMSYLAYDGNRMFQNQLASCGEKTARACGLDGSVCTQQQNSVSMLRARLGMRSAPNDVTPPTVRIISPAPGATVDAGFTIAATATDDFGVRIASLYIDGVASGSSLAPYTFATPANLAPGTHTFRVEVTDGKHTTSTELTVTVERGAPGSDGDADAGGCSTTPTTPPLLASAWALAWVLRRRRPVLQRARAQR